MDIMHSECGGTILTKLCEFNRAICEVERNAGERIKKRSERSHARDFGHFQLWRSLTSEFPRLR